MAGRALRAAVRAAFSTGAASRWPGVRASGTSPAPRSGALRRSRPRRSPPARSRGPDSQVGPAGEHLRRRGPDAEEGAGGRSEGPDRDPKLDKRHMRRRGCLPPRGPEARAPCCRPACPLKFTVTATVSESEPPSLTPAIAADAVDQPQLAHLPRVAAGVEEHDAVAAVRGARRQLVRARDEAVRRADVGQHLQVQGGRELEAPSAFAMPTAPESPFAALPASKSLELKCAVRRRPISKRAGPERLPA